MPILYKQNKISSEDKMAAKPFGGSSLEKEYNKKIVSSHRWYTA